LEALSRHLQDGQYKLRKGQEYFSRWHRLHIIELMGWRKSKVVVSVLDHPLVLHSSAHDLLKLR